MAKKIKKIIATVLVLCLAATLCVVPMTASAEETYEDYDVIEYGNLNNGSMPEGGTALPNKDNAYGFVSTSDTHSAILKFCVTVGSTDGRFEMHFGGWGNNNNFAYKLEDHYWKWQYNGEGVSAGSIVTGDNCNIEIARLKVKTGENIGKYYTYFKVNGGMIFEKYVSANDDNTTNYLGDTIFLFQQYTDPAYVISEYAELEAETYEAYDTIGYTDLYDNGEPVGSETQLGDRTFTYDQNSASGSVIFKYRWLPAAGSATESFLSFDTLDNGNWANQFGIQIFKADTDHPNGRIDLRPGYSGGEADLPYALETGKSYDIEVARLKVKTGPNKGKYYMYLKLDGTMLAEEYVYVAIDQDGKYTSNWDNLPATLSNKIYINNWGGNGGHKITYIPEPETFEDYDEIGYYDLYDNGEPVGSETQLGSRTYTYDQNSASGSAIFKYRWLPGTDAKSLLSFDVPNDTSQPNYMFGIQIEAPGDGHPNGTFVLRPGYGGNVDLPYALEAGKSYDIEFARLKVATGPNKGRYYVYFKLDGALLAEEYVNANIAADGSYTTNWDNIPVQLSNKIYITNWGGDGGHKITATPEPEKYEAYDEIGYADLRENGAELAAETGLGNKTFTYNKTSATGSAVLKICWKAVVGTEFQISFDKISDGGMDYMFGVQLFKADQEYPNGSICLRPGYSGGVRVALDQPITDGKYYNIEFARLKVKNGTDKGKYHLYFKFNNKLIAESYVDKDVVDADGNYTTEPGNKTCTLSNEIFMSFWGVDGNKISEYMKPGTYKHEGTKGDFDKNGTIDASDLPLLKKLLLGVDDLGALPEGIADYNLDGFTDVRDLVAVKKDFVAPNTHTRSGLQLGTQEHMYSDATKTPDWIADASVTLGASTYRLSKAVSTLFYPTENNDVGINETPMNEVKAMVAALKAKGINNILFVSDAFVLPYGYADPTVNHNKTVPDPDNDYENYVAWLTVNAAAFGKLAEEVPEIKAFEPFNEINLSGNRFEKPGIGWEAAENPAYRYSTEEKARIAADLCWYISKAVKAVDPVNQVTTPSISVDSNASAVETSFLDELYKAIESGNHPVNQKVADKRIDNYFSIVNIHLYPKFESNNSKLNTSLNNYENNLKAIYDVVKYHHDGNSPIWLTETGLASIDNNGAVRRDSAVTNVIAGLLSKLNNLTFVDSVYFYKLSESSNESGDGWVELSYGLFYSGDDLDYTPHGAKASAKAVYKYFHNGSTNYSELDALVARWANK